MCSDTVLSQIDDTGVQDVYSVHTLDAFLHRVYNVWHHTVLQRYNRIDWMQLPASLTIKTQSFKHVGEKCGCMYLWTLCVNGVLISGRNWESLRYVIYEIHRFFCTNAERKIIIYVYDLAFFFQFARRWFRWTDVFTFKPLSPCTCEVWGILFKCSKFLSGLEPEEIAEKAGYQIETLPEDKRMHTPDTVLTDPERREAVGLAYSQCLYIAHVIDQQKGVERIPMTKIGYIRRGCRDNVLLHKQVKDERKRKREMFAYRSVMQALQLDPDEYRLLKAAFRGGEMRANIDYIGKKLDDIVSDDISSSYAACIICDYFPMSRGRIEYITTEEELQELAGKYCVVCDLLFEGLAPVFGYEYYLPKSRCSDVEKAVTVNGRIAAASRLRTQMTEIDYNLMRKTYTWKSCTILRCYTYERGRLPSEFCRYIAELYQRKTQIKGIPGREREYNRVKEYLCSLYGMMVMSLDRDQYEYDVEQGCWKEPKKADVSEAVKEDNQKFARFTFYAWGVYVAAHARRRLWNAILNIREDFVYVHTDCIKFRHLQAHAAYFLEYNNRMQQQLRAASFYHDIPLSMLMPKNIKGEVKPLGFWELDEKYYTFKTTGAGRYFCCNADGGRWELCVSGLNPHKAGAYMKKVFKKNPMTAFKNGLHIPAEHTGRVIQYYIDSGYTAYVKDYQGRVGKIEERSCVHICPTDWTMGEGPEFFDFLQLLGEIDYEGGERLEL